ncbi:hypothetical protein ACOSQ2_014322 [Xanthoceras sorbifolium]
MASPIAPVEYNVLALTGAQPTILAVNPKVNTQPIQLVTKPSFVVPTVLSTVLLLSKNPLLLLALPFFLLIRGDLAEWACDLSPGGSDRGLLSRSTSSSERWYWSLRIGWFGAAVVFDLSAAAIGFDCSGVERSLSELVELCGLWWRGPKLGPS